MTHRIAPILLLGLVAAAAPAGQRQGSKGLTMTMTMSMTSPAKPTSTVVMMMKTRISSTGKGRTDFLPTDSTHDTTSTGDRPPLLRPGTYAISKRGNDTTITVDPAQRKAWVMLKSDYASPAAAVKNTNEQFTDVEVSATRVMPDSTIAGITVQHWRVIDNHAQKTHFMGSTNTDLTKAVYDIYSAPDFDIGGYNTASSLAGMPVGGDSAYGAKLHAAMAQAMPGVPLGMRMQMSMLNNKGKATTFGMAMAASNITRGDPPADIFVVPASYTKVRGSLAFAPAMAGAGTTPMRGVATGDTTHKSVLDTVAKQAGTDATTGVNDAAKAKIKSLIHFP